MNDPYNYGAVFVADEDSITAYIYKWKQKHKGYDTLDLHEIDYSFDIDPDDNSSKTIYPGIMSYVNKSFEEVDDYLLPVMYFVCDYVFGNRNNIPIYVRILEESGIFNLDTASQLNITNNIKDVIKSYRYKVASNCVTKVTKEEENAYDWLAMNYLKKSIFDNDDDDKRDASKKTYGIFRLSNNTNSAVFVPHTKPEKYEYNFTFGNSNYMLYDHSMQNYGRSDALKMVLDNITSNASSYVIQFPCFLKDYSSIYNGHLINGTGQGKACIRLISSMVNKYAECEDNTSSCAINGTYMPSITKGYNIFYASDEFHTIASILGLSTGIPTTLNYLQMSTRRYCNISWLDLKNQFEDPKFEERVALTCFDGAYSYCILNAYNISDVSKINFADNVEGISFNYAYGVMLSEIKVKK